MAAVLGNPNLGMAVNLGMVVSLGKAVVQGKAVILDIAMLVLDREVADLAFQIVVMAADNLVGIALKVEVGSLQEGIRDSLLVHEVVREHKLFQPL